MSACFLSHGRACRWQQHAFLQTSNCLMRGAFRLTPSAPTGGISVESHSLRSDDPFATPWIGSTLHSLRSKLADPGNAIQPPRRKRSALRSATSPRPLRCRSRALRARLRAADRSDRGALCQPLPNSHSLRDASRHLQKIMPHAARRPRRHARSIAGSIVSRAHQPRNPKRCKSRCTATTH
jgi:hypothetical protein